MHHEFRVSISDCPNACSRPQITDIGLIGTCSPIIMDQDCTKCDACVEACKEKAVLLKDGRPVIRADRCLSCGQCARLCPTGTISEGETGFRVLVGGKLGRHPRLATILPGIYPAEDIQRILNICLDHYRTYCLKGERFGEVLDPSGLEKLKIRIVTN